MKTLLSLVCRLRAGRGRYRLLVLFSLLLPSALHAQPLITDQPDSQSVFVGAQVVFSVTAETLSPGPLRFQWRRNGVDIPGAFVLRMGPVATDEFSVQGVQPTDCGLYSVVVSDDFGALGSDPVSLVVTNISSLPTQDLFDLRGDLGPLPFGAGRANNSDSTLEPGEPSHGAKRGGKSIWLQWAAPFTGIATFRTLGSGLDTTLAVYAGNAISSLLLLDQDDDDGGFLSSQVRFNAVAGTKYSLAIDGYYGASGDLVLNWDLEDTDDQVPMILGQPVGRTVTPGEDVTFAVVPSPNTQATYQWFLNGNAIPGATGPVLNIMGVEPSHVGTYRVRLRAFLSQIRDTFSRGATLQINTASGSINAKAAAMRKFQEAADPTTDPGTPASRPTEGGGAIRLAGGFTGTQIFNTYGSPKEPGEPNHCSEAGGSSYWFAYKTPAAGVLQVDTAGSTFNNVLAVYTGPGDSFATLVALPCSSTNPVAGAEAVSFSVPAGQTNYIVVDGVEGATGLVFLNYKLSSPPVITNQPASRTVTAGSNVTLLVGAEGSPTLHYFWRSNSVLLSGRTNATLTLTNFQTTYEAGYDVIVSNALGSVTSSVASLYVDAPLRFTENVIANNQFTTRLLGRANTNYVLQFSTNLSVSNWTSVSTNFTSTGILHYTNSFTGYSNRFFRARRQ